MKSLRWGLTTGTCAAVAAKAAATLLLTGEQVDRAEISLPDGERVSLPVHDLNLAEGVAEATVEKDAGDDPDVTHQALLRVKVALNGRDCHRFIAGPGVGVVTKSGLALPPGEAAINPGPRQLISSALAELSSAGFDVTVSAPDGERLAAQTFNPRLGIVGGISILGTTGRVRPFSASALRAGLKCALDVAVAEKHDALVAVPGNMGRRSALKYFQIGVSQVIEVSNEWGYMLEQLAGLGLRRLLLLGHPGKLGKLAMGQWQTHSAQSQSAVPLVQELCQAAGMTLPETANTVEELFMVQLSGAERQLIADRLAERIRLTVARKFVQLPEIAVVLINLQGELIGSSGSLTPWDKSGEEPVAG